MSGTASHNIPLSRISEAVQSALFQTPDSKNVCVSDTGPSMSHLYPPLSKNWEYPNIVRIHVIIWWQP